MSTLVKICGITNIADALDAVELGADYLGFNFYQDSPRYISPDDCKVLLSDIPFSIGKVGVFVNADPQYVIDVSTGLNLDLLQFHGDETAVYCEQFARPVMKAIRPKNESDVTALKDFNTDFVLVDAFVQDSYGGTGVVSNWDLAKEAKQYGKLFLSGGNDFITIPTYFVGWQDMKIPKTSIQLGWKKESITTFKVFQVDDNNWEYGASKHFTGFLTYNLSVYKELISDGSMEFVIEGEARKLKSIKEVGRFLYVVLEGEKFQGNSELREIEFIQRTLK